MAFMPLEKSVVILCKFYMLWHLMLGFKVATARADKFLVSQKKSSCQNLF